ARIALRVFVRELGALGRHHRRARVVFRRDELDVLLLAAIFGTDRLPQLGIRLRQRGGTAEHGGCGRENTNSSIAYNSPSAARPAFCAAAVVNMPATAHAGATARHEGGNVNGLLALSRAIDALTERVGRLVYWLVLIVVLISAANATVRKI